MPRRFSALWQGGQFTINFVTQNLPARWHRADAVDADNDSIPDDIDPYLNDAGNPTLQAGQFYWAGGSFRIDGQMNTFAGGVFTGMDGDGLPDHFDAWPADPSNNSAWWPGGTFTISGQSETLAGQWHHANSGDQDSDTIPDDLDPFPSDPNNGTVVPAYWAGGTFIIDGQSVPFAGQNYTGDFIDPDGDGLPNFADPYPSDGTNNSFNWSGGEFTINDIFVRFGPGWYAGSSTDNNNNNVPDCLDDWFVDPSTHGQFQQWTGGTFTCDGQPRTWPALKYYASALNDADLDTIPDEIDPYPADANNHSGFIWPAEQMTLLYGNVQTTFNPTPYGGDFVDADTDTIPDQAETNDYVNDEWNGNDTDGDLIPDHVEVQYPTLLDRTNASDATNLRPADGITYLRLYQYNVEAATQSTPLAAVALDQPFPARDSDIDTMPDVYELRYTLDPFDRLDAVESPAGDLVFNFEKAAHADDPATPISPENYTAYTSQTHADALSHHNNAQSNAENDWDGDKVSNIDELFVFGTNARNVSLRPDDATIIWAITGTHLLSASTGIHFLYLVTPCICSNADCPHSITCNSTDHSAGCVCTYPPSCICSNNSTCPHNSTCVCTGNCFPPPPTCGCNGNICPITGCSCNGNSGNCTWTANCDCTSLGCPGKILGGFCGTGGPFCTCGGSTGCLCLKSGCPTSTCTCGGTATCGGGPGFCPGCVNMNCVSSGCSCAGSGTCPSPPPPCNCGMSTCPGTTIANDGVCSHFYAGACSGCCYCGHSGCPGGYCGNAGQGTGSCTCNTYCNGSCGTTGCPGSGCMCAYAGNCVPVPCGGNGGIPCGATNGVVSCPGAGCTCGGLSSLSNLSSPGSCVPPLPPIEIEQQGYSASEGIRFCRWLDSFPSDTFTEVAADNDRDAFRIKINKVIPGLTRARIKTTGLHGTMVNGKFESISTDGDYEIEMWEEGGKMVSKRIMLVGDGDDDKSYNGLAGAGETHDNQYNDQTLLADFGSTVVVTFPELGGHEAKFNVQQPKGVLTLAPYFVSLSGGPLETKHSTAILNHLRKTREIYRQQGIQINWGNDIHPYQLPADPWTGYFAEQGIGSFYQAANVLSAGEKQALAVEMNANVILAGLPADQILVVYSEASFGFNDDITAFIQGIVYLEQPPALVSIYFHHDETPWFNNNRALNVTAHEVGHTLKLQHPEGPSAPPIPHRLMSKVNAYSNGHRSAKRLIESEVSTVKQQTRYYYEPQN